MNIKEMVLQRLEYQLLTRAYSEQELCLLAMQYASELYAEALHLRFVQWKDLEAIRKDLFTFPSEQGGK